jgi:predicted nucleic acid-binding Zn ribbon protein
MNMNATSSLTQCTTCGREVPSDSQVCGNCGTKMSKAEEQKPCSACGKSVHTGERFCGYCGTSSSKDANRDSSRIESEPSHGAEPPRFGYEQTDSDRHKMRMILIVGASLLLLIIGFFLFAHTSKIPHPNQSATVDSPQADSSGTNYSSPQESEYPKPSAAVPTEQTLTDENRFPTATQSGTNCYRNGDFVALRGTASSQELEMPNGSTRTAWILVTDESLCIVTSPSSEAGGHQVNVRRVQVIGVPPPTGIALELTGKLSTGHVGPNYAESTTLNVIRGRKLETDVPSLATSSSPN